MGAPDIDYLIIGQGLAGSLLAWTLLQRQQQIHLIDDHHSGSASLAAAGLVNPLGGMRFNRLPHLEECLAAAGEDYRALEQVLGIPLWHPLGMVRLFREPGQRRFWERRRDDPACAPYLGAPFPPGGSGYAQLDDRHGGFRQRHTGYLAVSRLLRALRDRFRAQDLLSESAFVPDALHFTPRGLRYGERHCRRLVFCEGHRATRNPWFDWLPLQPAKGEILTLGSETPLADEIINARHWLLPLAEGGYRFGATNDHQRLDSQPTTEARQALLAGFQALFPHLPTPAVTDHRAGVRPNTSDRRPLLGAHPQHPELLVFNGFGGRGSLTIPWHARVFANWLDGRGELPADADIARLS